MTTPTITVLVHSFNRPRLIREALASVVAGNPDEIIVCDDGSTFDIAATCRDFGAQLLTLPPLTVAERMVATRQGPLINRALELAHGDVIAYLCDDDLHDERWYTHLRASFAVDPSLALVRGLWLVFNDGAPPTLADPRCPLDRRQMTAGNFAHHRRLYHELGVRWPEQVHNCHDNGFLLSCHAHGVNMYKAPLVGCAGWRRLHAKTLIKFSDGQNNLPSLRPVLEKGFME